MNPQSAVRNVGFAARFGQELTLEFPASVGDLLQTAALLKSGWTSTPFVRVRVLNRGELARTA